MKMEIVKMIGNRLRQAREELGWSQEESASRLGITREYLSRLENGRRTVPMRLLKQLADLYGYPVNWFYGVGEPTGSFQLLLRASENQAFSHETWRALRKFVDICEEIAHLRQLLGEEIPRLPLYPPKRNLDQLALEVAHAERARLGLDGACAVRLPELLESHGVAIVRLPMTDEVSGAMAYDSDKGAFILVNSHDHPTRQLWTIAHEYGHLLMDREKGYRLPELVDNPTKKPDREGKEYFAHRFAVHLLMPEEHLRALFAHKPVSIREIIEARRALGVSYPALLYRLHELEYLSKNDVELLQKVALNKMETVLFGADAQEPVFPESASPLLRRLALQAVIQGAISISYAGELLEISPVEVQEIIDEIEVLTDEKKLKSSRRRHHYAV